MQAFDLEPFAKYLKDRGLTKDHNIPYYVKWVQKFLSADLPDIVTSTNDRIQAFENLLAKDHSLKDWQLWQALKAVELYVKVFVKGTSPDVPKPADTDSAIQESERVLVQMRDLIRVRHYAYRTEQTYLDWVRRYIE